ncbi:MAG: NUDIX hydrolase [Ktedonobacteraceae bacterium]|nr:NUDIX hydrolase [Ktedonobacteraceae bacterium]
MNSPLRIGVSGHQQLADQTTIAFVAQRFREILVSYQQLGQDVVLFSALAMGADQLFVRTAFEVGIPVEVVIPCADYEAIFPLGTARDEYERLLRACRTIHRLSTERCSDETYLAAGHWLVEHCDLMVLAWNGLPPKGRGGTGDVASYAWFVKRPFVHLDTRKHVVKSYGESTSLAAVPALSPKREFAVTQQAVYQGTTLVVNQYRLRMPDGREVLRDIVERPESVLILPVGQQDILLLVEEYDLAAGAWQLKLPGGKVERATPEGIRDQAHKELRQELGYKAGRLEKLLDFYSHPGYVSHKVHLFVASDLEWNPLEREMQEEIQVQTYTLQEAVAATLVDYRCDPEAALALFLYAHRQASSR